MTKRHDTIHPALRAAVNEILPAPLDPIGGPLHPEQPMALRLTYSDLIDTIAGTEAEGSFLDVSDLPELSHEELGAVLKHYPSAFIEAMADRDVALPNLVTAALANALNRPSQHYQLVGLYIVGALREYVLPLVLRDVQLQVLANQEADAVERLSARSEERAAVREAGRLS